MKPLPVVGLKAGPIIARLARADEMGPLLDALSAEERAALKVELKALWYGFDPDASYVMSFGDESVGPKFEDDHAFIAWAAVLEAAAAGDA